MLYFTILGIQNYCSECSGLYRCHQINFKWKKNVAYFLKSLGGGVCDIDTYIFIVIDITA